jgi:hypothetical protein
MNPINEITSPVPRPKAVVKGPIRCHKCQMLCCDAEEYLSHNCDRQAKQPESGILVMPKL